uniref:Uncharacterized protein n=1 Tax=Arundo donax TaxID=35708 RepID=A0A0A9A7B7_ARUDO
MSVRLFWNHAWVMLTTSCKEQLEGRVLLIGIH